MSIFNDFFNFHNQRCCACYELTFTSGPVKGKKMIVQATNTGGDLGDDHFDIQIPGGDPFFVIYLSKII